MPKPLCILLVDNSEFSLKLGSQFLRNTPATILTAQSGPEAIDMTRVYRPSLVYMAIDMPTMSGIECCEIIKQDPDLANIPIILIGNREYPEKRAEALKAPCNDYLEKPLDRRAFLNLGHNFLFKIERREPRKSINLPVTVTYHGQVSQLVALDISLGGMFIECSYEACTGDPLLLQFQLPVSRSPKLSLKGRIAWINIAGQGHRPDYPDGYGVEFVDIPEAAGIVLRRCFDQ